MSKSLAIYAAVVMTAMVEVLLVDHLPVAFVSCALDPVQLSAVAGSEDPDCTHSTSARTMHECVRDDGVPCSTIQYWYVYQDNPASKNVLLEDYTYCTIGARCVNVAGRRVSPTSCKPIPDPRGWDY